MDAAAGASLMVMYEDESVDVRYGNGARLQLSPCGCEFMLVRPTEPPGHPLQPPERVRQRTRFTTSSYKELLVVALAFRNKFAAHPYLPEELVPTDRKKPFFSMDAEARWSERSSSDAELGPGGETIIRSKEGRAALTLSPSGEEFSVEFTCRLSRPQVQQRASGLFCPAMRAESRRGPQEAGRSEEESAGSPGCSSAARPKQEAVHQSTPVTQHHSCLAVAPLWSYPLSLARHLRTARLSKLDDVRAEGVADRGQRISSEERRSRLPQALPLMCSAPHRHRWNVRDPFTKRDHPDQDLLTELVKVMWCHGVTYRVLGGAVSAVEVSPGDGSVIRSNGVLSTYFIHHKQELQSGLMKEVVYHLNNLPPDVPGQPYSICTIVSCASRILSGYDEAKLSLKLPANPSCLQGEHFCKPAATEENLSGVFSAEQRVGVTQAECGSDLVAAELEKIKRFNFLLENHNLLGEERCEVNESCVTEALQRTSRAIEDIDALLSARLT